MTTGGRPPQRRVPSAPGIPTVKLPPIVQTEDEAEREKRTSDQRELFWLETLRKSEERARADLAQRDALIEELEDQVHSLRSADEQAERLRTQFEQAQIIQMTTTITLEVQKQLTAALAQRARTEGSVAGTLAGHDAGNSTAKRWVALGTFAAAFVAGLISYGPRACTPEEKPLPPAKETPAPGPGYGGRL